MRATETTAVLGDVLMFPFKPAEAFAINMDLDIEILTLEGTDNQVVIADNFYQNPDLVREAARAFPGHVADKKGKR